MSTGRTSAWRTILGQLAPLLALVIVFFFFAVADQLQPNGGQFLSLRNIQTMLISSAPVMAAALGMTVVIIAGGIDLSAGTGIALCATVLAWTMDHDFSIGPAIACCVLTGCAAGSLNGGLISRLKVPPFIVTLGTMMVFLGIAKFIAKETTIRPSRELIPDWINGLATPTPEPWWLFVAAGFWIILGMALLMGIVLRYTVFGRYVFALGSN